MSWLSEWMRRLRFRMRGARFEEDLAEEMRLHLDLRAQQKRDQGMAPDAAEAAARRQFGNFTSLREVSREAWGWTFLDRLRQDLRQAARTLGASRAFTAAALLSLALGIGANTAIFSILNAVLLRTLPVEDPNSLVQVAFQNGEDELNTPLWEGLRDRREPFRGMLAYASERFDLSTEGESHYALGMYASGDFFRVLGAPAMLGRTFTDADDQWGGGSAGLVAVVSYRFWKQHLGGTPDALGKRLQLNRHPFTVIGVTPPWFSGLDADHGFDVAIPVGSVAIMQPDHKRADEGFHWWLHILGRLPAGLSQQQAADRLLAYSPELVRSTLPAGSGEPPKLALRPAALGFSAARTKYRTALLVLMAAAGLVLLIACANIANLLLARGTAKRRELSVRMAIGASRWRVVRQLMTESLLLAIAGSVCGILIALWMERLLLGLLSTARNPLEIGLTPDLRVLAFTALLACGTAVLFGMAPALRSTRITLSQGVKEQDRRLQDAWKGWHAGTLLVAGQVALSLLLLTAAGLSLGTLRNLLKVDTGFDPHGVLLVRATLNGQVAPALRSGIYDEALARLGRLPDVVSASSSFLAPLGPEGWQQPTYPQGFQAKTRRETALLFNRISPRYFETMGTPLLLGRTFNERDTLTAPPVIIISESTARTFFGTANPIGKTIGLDRRIGGTIDQHEVVGVVKDSKYNRVDEPLRHLGFLANTQDMSPEPWAVFEVRTRRAVEDLIPSIRTAMSGADRRLSIEFRDFETQTSESLTEPKVVALLSGIFGGLALLLAMVGLYGMTSYAVSRRKGEIGIRIALGARQLNVCWLILRDVAILMTLGLLLGMGVSVGLLRVMKSLLFGVQAGDPSYTAAAAVILIGAAGIAALLPALRAARLDPMVTLREE